MYIFYTLKSIKKAKPFRGFAFFAAIIINYYLLEFVCESYCKASKIKYAFSIYT